MSSLDSATFHPTARDIGVPDTRSWSGAFGDLVVAEPPWNEVETIDEPVDIRMRRDERIQLRFDPVAHARELIFTINTHVNT